MKHVSIVWFRNDLRLHDNEALQEAISRCENIIPVYVFDERVFFGKTKFGFEKCGKFRTKFIIESVEDLRMNLRSKGSDLLVRVGKPEEVIFDLAKQYKTSWVFCNRERTAEEVYVQDNLEKKLWTIGQEMRYVRGKMLLHTADLPFPVCQVPDVFTQFRKEVENIISVREPIPVPNFIPPMPPMIEVGEIPELQKFNKGDIDFEFEENRFFCGGESKALDQLNYYIWETNNVSNYKLTRNGLLGWDYSSKFSAWLSSGCISPKLIYQQLKLYEQQVIKNDSTYWLYFELLWRDYFRLVGKKHGNKIFWSKGLKGKVNQIFKNDNFDLWAKGKTGEKFVDANMIQLNQTGFMSNRGRQIVASYLINDLKVNWLLGAEYFESLLVDYDPCSNYGNWLCLAGLGNDPREERYFNIETQEKKYDPHGKFSKYWLSASREDVFAM